MKTGWVVHGGVAAFCLLAATCALSQDTRSLFVGDINGIKRGQAAVIEGAVRDDPNGARIKCGPGGSANTDCTAELPLGETITLRAYPSEGFRLESWTGACTGVGACVVVMDADRAVDADFVAVLDDDSDGLENDQDNCPQDANASQVDTDGDGQGDACDDDDDNDRLSDTQEQQLGTDPLKPDSDGDGASDADEVDAGSDPLDPDSEPETSGLNLALLVQAINDRDPAPPGGGTDSGGGDGGDGGDSGGDDGSDGGSPSNCPAPDAAGLALGGIGLASPPLTPVPAPLGDGDYIYYVPVSTTGNPDYAGEFSVVGVSNSGTENLAFDIWLSECPTQEAFSSGSCSAVGATSLAWQQSAAPGRCEIPTNRSIHLNFQINADISGEVVQSTICRLNELLDGAACSIEVDFSASGMP